MLTAIATVIETEATSQILGVGSRRMKPKKEEKVKPGSAATTPITMSKPLPSAGQHTQGTALTEPVGAKGKAHPRGKWQFFGRGTPGEGKD